MPDPLAHNSVDNLPFEADELVRKMYRHIMYDNCSHCKHILNNNNNEAGNQPAPTAATHQHPTKELGVLQ